MLIHINLVLTSLDKPARLIIRLLFGFVSDLSNSIKTKQTLSRPHVIPYLNIYAFECKSICLRLDLQEEMFQNKASLNNAQNIMTSSILMPQIL